MDTEEYGGLKPLSEEELDSLTLPELAKRMDTVLDAPYFDRLSGKIMKTRVGHLLGTKAFREFPVEFQRKLVYKTFGFLLQMTYSSSALSAQFFRIDEDNRDIELLHQAAKVQWVMVSSRIAFEYFMHLTYMLGTGDDFPGNKASKTYRRWLKTPSNLYSYFAISAARATKYDREMRSPEVHAGTRLARKVLLKAPILMDPRLLKLHAMLLNQWQFVLEIADGKVPGGWVSVHDSEVDKEWYEIWESGDRERIESEIDRLFDEIETPNV